MSMPKGKKIDRGYATVVEEGGANYRSIAEAMTAAGHPMNHASARNHWLRVMRKFAEATLEAGGEEVTDERLELMARDPSFQSGIGQILERILHE